MKGFSIVENGYDINEVNKFVDVVIRKLDLINKENIELKKEITHLKNRKTEITNEGRNEFSQKQTNIYEPKFTNKESLLIIEDAKRNANAIIHEALVQAEKINTQSQILEKNITIYKNRVKSLLQAQLEIADELDSIKLQ